MAEPDLCPTEMVKNFDLHFFKGYRMIMYICPLCVICTTNTYIMQMTFCPDDICSMRWRTKKPLDKTHFFDFSISQKNMNPTTTFQKDDVALFLIKFETNCK